MRRVRGRGGSRLAVLSAYDVVKSYDGWRVLDGVSLAASPGHRLGLVGGNGAGKSALLRILAGCTDPDGGAVTAPPEVGLLHQELPYRAQDTIAEVVDAALAGIRTAAARLPDRAGGLAAGRGRARSGC